MRWKRRRDEDFSDEIRAHLALETDRLIAEGLSPEAARLKAHRAFGNVARAQEQFYESRRLIWLDDLGRDLAYALRSLGRTPGFAAIAVITLALGIGANTAIFSVLNAVVLRSLPYKDADRFVRISEDIPGGDVRPIGLTKFELDMLRASTWTLSHAGVYLPASFTFSTPEQAVRVSGIQMSPAIMSMLGVAPILGRIFEPREDAPMDRVVILSHRAWQRYLLEDRDILGQKLLFDGIPYSVIGVMPAGFAFPDSGAEFWIPLVFPQGARLAVTARIRDGMPRDAASHEISTLLHRFRTSSPFAGAAPPPPPPPPPPSGGGRRTLEEVLAQPPVSMVPLPKPRADRRPPEPPRVRLVGFQDFIVGSTKNALLMISVAVGFVLLIACVNVANLLLARSAGRQREFAVRLALGAGRGRLIRQLLTESALLAFAGGVAGTALAFGGVKLVRGLGQALPRTGFGPSFGLPRVEEVQIDMAVLVFTVAISVIVGLAAGLMPALRYSHAMGLEEALRAGSSTTAIWARWVRRPRASAVLVVSELALATVLFVGAALVIHSFVKLSNVDPGYNAAGLLTFQVVLPPGRDAVTFRDTFHSRLVALPAVQGVAYSDQTPMGNRRGTVFLRTSPGAPTGPPPPPSPSGGGPPQFPDLRIVSREFFQVMGVRVIQGRGFSEEDVANHSNVMVINRALARSGYLGADPIGQTVYALGPMPWQVIGIADDVRQSGLDQEPGPQIFVEFRQFGALSETRPRLLPHFVVRSDRDMASTVSVVREMVKQLDRQATLDGVATMEQIVSNTIVRPRFNAVLIGTFAGVAGILALVGIYGVMAYTVRQRSREIGVRTALGAGRAAILLLILRQGLTLAVVGIALGLLASLATTRYLSGMLFGLTPLDAPTYLAVAIGFALVSSFAAYLPARRATRLDPVVALRHE